MSIIWLVMNPTNTQDIYSLQETAKGDFKHLPPCYFTTEQYHKIAQANILDPKNH